MTVYDHGFPVDLDRFCSATTKKRRRCANHALIDNEHCALHAGRAEPSRYLVAGMRAAVRENLAAFARGELELSPPRLRRSALPKRLHPPPPGTATPTPAMVFFHRTTDAAAADILSGGFKDGAGSYLTSKKFKGVWLSDAPLDCNEGAKGDALLKVTMDLPGRAIARYEWVEEGKPYREWLVPARLINRHAKVRLMDANGDELRP